MNFAVAADLDLFVMGAARPGGRTLHNRSHKFRPPPYRRDSLMATRRGEKFSLEQMTQKKIGSYLDFSLTEYLPGT